MGVLSGIRIVEIEGIGPAPFAGMHLADLGADVVVVERPGAQQIGDIGVNSVLKRGKRVVTLNLKGASDRDRLMDLLRGADGLIEGMRPGVMERLGLGPNACHAVNPRLVYGRVTGWGQSGPLAHAAGHDINYISLSGAAWFSGRPGEAPVAPPTLVGDIAGGALYLTIGMLGALLQAARTGAGDVVDAAIVDGSAHMMNLVLALKAFGGVDYTRGRSILDGPHWFDSYACKDGGFVSVGALEPQFYAELLARLGLDDDPDFKGQMDPDQWPAQKAKMAVVFATKTQDEWCALLEGTDACFAPVLNPEEAAEHPHMVARGSYQRHNGHFEGAPAPKFLNSGNAPKRQIALDAEFDALLAEWSEQDQ